MTEAIPAFIAAMTSAGITPLEPIASALSTGELVRFRAQGDKPGRRNGWAVIYLDGNPAGCFGHYRLGIRASWRSGQTRELSHADRQAIARRIREAEAKRSAEIDAGRISAVSAWQNASEPSREHLYLIGKGLAPFGVRQSGGDLLVPMVDEHMSLWNVQRVGRDGFKRFLPGARTAALFWPFGVSKLAGGRNDGPLVIGEGYGTCATIHEATGYGVAAALSAKNLLSVALAMRRTFPRREIIIAADHDGHLPRNLGVESATEAAERVGGVLALPIAAGAEGDAVGVGVDFADICRADAAALIEIARMGKAVARG